MDWRQMSVRLRVGECSVLIDGPWNNEEVTETDFND